MTSDALIKKIDERFEALAAEKRKAGEAPMSERKLLLHADLDAATIRRIRDRGQVPSVSILAKLEVALRCPPGYLIEAVTDRGAKVAPIRLGAVYVRGAVEAGVWKSALEWPGDEWFPVSIPVDERYADIPIFGLLVIGPSMDRLYPDGTIVVVAPYFYLERQPNPGDRVVAVRRSDTDDSFEATLKEYERDSSGRHILWPRSHAPEFQAPIVLERDLPVAGHASSLLDGEHEAGMGDLVITALVIGSYRPEHRI